VGKAAKILTGVGALLLLASGACFLALDDALGGTERTPWTIGVALIVGGVVALVALLGMTRGNG